MLFTDTVKPCLSLWVVLRAPCLSLWVVLRAPCLSLWVVLRAPCLSLWERCPQGGEGPLSHG